ncbi:hypothetical protein NLJ89_g7313 [Agrocybe chaxingu]|uniref:RRM domain-containing protein n=1 Tax=Agrocybe chaxingu TaxID=84603 RepID=A0A9W8MTU0_9AGAR|nr:hypothetical protein NLJ89_g7313 [Agrocybe chaxingu]
MNNSYDQGHQGDMGGYGYDQPPNSQQPYYQSSNYADSTPAHFPPQPTGYGLGYSKYEGMVFVTYFDLRAAERARERLQGSEISGRPIDVHYSLPRDDQKGPDREKNQQFQGTLQVSLRNSVSGQSIDDNEVRRKFQQFGDVKSVRPVGDRIDSRYVEFYDTRACSEAHDRLRHQGLQDGVMEIVFAWDASEGPSSGPRDSNRDWDDRGGGGGGGGGMRGGRGRGAVAVAEEEAAMTTTIVAVVIMDVKIETIEVEEEAAMMTTVGEEGDQGALLIGTTAMVDMEGRPPEIMAEALLDMECLRPVDDRLEQARRVQQLLAALKQPATGGASAQPGIPPTPAGQPPPNPYYPPPPPAAGPYAAAPTNPYTGMPPPMASAQSIGAQPAANPSLAGLPPNILALVQSAQQQQRPPGAPGQPFGMPPPHLMNAPPPGALGATAPPGAGNPQYQQLMAYLQTQAAAQAAAGKQ